MLLEGLEEQVEGPVVTEKKGIPHLINSFAKILGIRRSFKHLNFVTVKPHNLYALDQVYVQISPKSPSSEIVTLLVRNGSY